MDALWLAWSAAIWQSYTIYADLRVQRHPHEAVQYAV